MFVAALSEITASVVYLNTTNFNDFHSYCNNVSKSEIHLDPGVYYLNTSMVLDRVEDFTLSGIDCRIICTSPGIGFVVTNVSQFTLHNIILEDCGTNYTQSLHSHIEYDYIRFSGYHGSLILHDCTKVMIKNVTIIVRSGTTGIMAINLKSLSIITDITVALNCSDHLTLLGYPAQINGVLMYHYNSTDPREHNFKNVNYVIDNLQYKANKGCNPISQYVLGILLFQKNYNISFTIQNTRFNTLYNTSALYYFGETCGIGVHSNLTIRDVTVSYNVGNSLLKMFQIILYNLGCFNTAINKQLYSKQQYNNITFLDCNFTNNQNMKSMIHLSPSSTRAITGYLNFNNTKFCHNQDVHYINVERSVEIIWQLTNLMEIKNTVVSWNNHSDGRSLISITNGALILQSSEVNQNQNYQNVIRIIMSPIFFTKYVEISSNVARHILKASKDGSYFTMTVNTTLAITNNTVYMIALQEHRFGVDSRQICPIQFYSKYGNLDKRLDELNDIFRLNITHNQYMISKYYHDQDESLQNCTWIADSAFYKASSADVFNRTLTMRNSVISSGDKRPIPLSVCPCSDNSDRGNCHSGDLGELSAGQTLQVNFTVPRYSRYTIAKLLTTATITLTVENSADDDCIIVDPSQLTQTHINNYSCNKYYFTIWPQRSDIAKCKLFVGLPGKPEMFFVQIKPCPKGFKRQEDRQTCYCDSALNSAVLSITSCNLDDETIERPARSWIFASTDHNSSHTYQVSPYCPFDYCSPHSSHLNLSHPDSQCQFNRVGRLCGQCQHGLSAVFGSSQCKPCSNVYLPIVIPIAIAGIVLVILLFIFNLSVINGSINTFIFYVNILSINTSMFSSSCQPVSCVVVSLANLDLGIETCFYNGMDDYAKTWLQLLFPAYLIMIAILLIIASRYSATVQRLTARGALPVLATLFLLSYTKILRIVCFVLFWYTTVTHLPSNKSNLTWLVDTTAKIFGLKYLMLFLVCLILLLLLFPFNITLLFARSKLLSNIKLIHTFKPLLDAYFAPYKDKHFYWSGLLLLIRIIIYSFTALDKDNKFTAITMVLTGLLCIQGILQPFKTILNNIQESVVLFILLAVHVSTYTETTLLGISLVQILTSASLVYFTVVVAFLCCRNKCKKNIDNYTVSFNKGMLLFNPWATSKADAFNDNHSTKLLTFTRQTSDSLNKYREFQEPLVEFDD